MHDEPNANAFRTREEHGIPPTGDDRPVMTHGRLVPDRWRNRIRITRRGLSAVARSKPNTVHLADGRKRGTELRISNPFRW